MTLRQHIGGRWAISWVLFVVNIPFNLLSISTTISQTPDGEQWLGWVVVALLGLATIGLFFLVGDLFIFRHRRTHPYPVWSVYTYGGIIGVARGAVVVAGADALGLQAATAGSFANRMIAGGLIGALALPLGAFVFSVIDRYRVQRRLLLEELAKGERRRLADEEEVRRLRAAVVQGVRDEVLDVAQTAIAKGGGPKEVSAALRRTSHELWAADERTRASSDPPLRILQTTWQGVKAHRLPTGWISGMWGVSAAATLISGQGLAGGIAQLAFCVTALVLCLSLANLWIKKSPDRWLIVAILFVLLSWVATSPLAFMLFAPQPLETALPVMVLNFFWLPIVVGLVSVAVSAVKSTEVVLDSLQDSVAEAEVRSRALEVERDEIIKELAEQLHGSVHSPLISRAALDPDRDRLAEHLGQAVAALGIASDELPLRERLAALCESWSGLMDVQIGHCDSTVRDRDVERVVVEAVTNAYRHGRASRVDIRVNAEHGFVEIRVHDDGTNDPKAVAPGLGSRLFDTLGEWSLSHSAGGSTMVMRISTR